MFIQFKHVGANEVFYHLPSLLGVQYKKVNHGRGRVLGQNGTPYKGRPIFRRFKPNDVVLTTLQKTNENAWMELSI